MYKNTKQLLAALIVLGFAFPSNAYAYLDPGTGSLIIQTLIGLLLAVGFAGRMYWAKLKSLFRSSKSKDSSEKEIENTDKSKDIRHVG